MSRPAAVLLAGAVLGVCMQRRHVGTGLTGAADAAGSRA